MSKYNVIFVLTEYAGPYEGMRTWMSNSSKEKWEQSIRYKECTKPNAIWKVFAEGVSDKDAFGLVNNFDITPKTYTLTDGDIEEIVSKTTKRVNEITREVNEIIREMVPDLIKKYAKKDKKEGE